MAAYPGWGSVNSPVEGQVVEIPLFTTRWWFQIKYFLFSIPTWGRWTHFDSYFSEGVGSTTNQTRFSTTKRWLALGISEPTVLSTAPKSPRSENFTNVTGWTQVTDPKGRITPWSGRVLTLGGWRHVRAELLWLLWKEGRKEGRKV